MGPHLYEDNNIEEAALALRLLARTRQLLSDGQRWRGDKIAAVRLGFACDPLSPRAHYFSLIEAAARARWELREELAQATGEIWVVDILRAMSAKQGSPYCGQLGWRDVKAILDGLEGALQDYGNLRSQDEYYRRA